MIYCALLPSHSSSLTSDGLPPKYFFFLFNPGTKGCTKSASNAAVSGALDNLKGPCQKVSAAWCAIGSVLIEKHCCGYGKEKLPSTKIRMVPLDEDYPSIS